MKIWVISNWFKK